MNSELLTPFLGTFVANPLMTWFAPILSHGLIQSEHELAA